MIKNQSIASLHESQLQVLVFPKPKISSFIWKLIIDVFVVCGCLKLTSYFHAYLVELPIMLCTLFAKPDHRGFYCNDASIRYPYHDDTITASEVLFFSLSIPIISIVINEFFIVRSVFLKDQLENYYLKSRHFWTCYIWQIYLQILPSFIFTTITSAIITDISKLTIGRLRPHFIDLCQPQIELTGQILLRNTTCADPYTFVEEYHCTNEKYSEKLLNDAHSSFMSGHASTSSACLIYLVFYIQNRVKWPWMGLTRHLYQAVLIFMVIYTGLSRISDYKHHWSDVFTGFISGTLTATLVATFVSDLVNVHTFYRVDEVDNGGESGLKEQQNDSTSTFDSNV